MEIAFADDEYFRLEVVGPGTAGIPYDCRVAASMKCGAFSGATEAWLEGPEVKAFIESLKSLNATLHGNASLLSHDGRALTLFLGPSDSLGHYALEVKMAKDVGYGSKSYQSSTQVVFVLEAQALTSLCKALIEGVGGESDA